jgi:hypothetical protein
LGGRVGVTDLLELVGVALDQQNHGLLEKCLGLGLLALREKRIRVRVS